MVVAAERETDMTKRLPKPAQNWNWARIKHRVHLSIEKSNYLFVVNLSTEP